MKKYKKIRYNNDKGGDKMANINYVCPKCDSRNYEITNVSMTGSGIAKIFDVQNNKFSAVSCSNCKYTEFYKAETSALSNIFDLLIGG